MSIFGRIKRFFNLSVTDPKAWDSSFWRLFGASAGGENVNEYTALNYSAVYNAVTLISGTVSTLPMRLIRRENRRTITEDSNTLHRVLHDQANPYMTAMCLRETMMAHLLLWGNAYAEIKRGGTNQVLELWPITPDRVTMRFVDGQLYYDINVDAGAPVRLPREKVLHLAGLGFDGFQGYSVVSLARKSIGLGMAMETFGSEYFNNGTHPGVIVTHPGKLDPQTLANMSESLRASYSGLGNSHRLMLLEEGLKMERVTMPNNDSQFLESRQFQIPEIARWFNLPPHKLKDLTKSSFSNIESEQISFVTDSILPWLIRIEQSYNAQLLTDPEKRRGLYTKHTVEGLMRGSAKDRAEYYTKMFGIGAITINEIREKEDCDPSDNKYADELFVPVNNMIPLSKIDEYLAKGGSEKPAVKPEETTDEEVV